MVLIRARDGKMIHGKHVDSFRGQLNTRWGMKECAARVSLSRVENKALQKESRKEVKCIHCLAVPAAKRRLDRTTLLTTDSVCSFKTFIRHLLPALCSVRSFEHTIWQARPLVR